MGYLEDQHYWQSKLNQINCTNDSIAENENNYLSTRFKYTNCPVIKNNLFCIMLSKHMWILIHWILFCSTIIFITMPYHAHQLYSFLWETTICLTCCRVKKLLQDINSHRNRCVLIFHVCFCYYCVIIIRT